MNWLFSSKAWIAAIIFWVVLAIFTYVDEEIDDAKTDDLYAQCDAACEKNDFETAHNLLAQIENMPRSFEYSEKKQKVFDKEILYLVSMNTEDASDRIAYLLTDFFELASKPMPEGTYDDFDPSDVDNYNYNVSKANEYYNKIFLLAASQGNKYLCKKLLYFYREEAVYQKVEKNNSKDSQKDTKDDNDPKETYIVSYNNSARESAILKYKTFFGEEPNLDQNEEITE